MAERWEEAPGVELDALRLLEPACTRKESLEAVGVFLHGARAPALGELEHGRGSERGPEPEVEEILEVAPIRRALVGLQLGEPQLCDVIQMVRRHGYALVHGGAVLAEVGFAFVDEEHRIGRAVVAGKVPLLMLGVEVLTARAIVATVVAPAGGRLGLVLHGGHVRLHGVHLRVHGLEHLHDFSEGGLGHGG